MHFFRDIFVPSPQEPPSCRHHDMKILIDNGHGIQTKGKRSPDGKFLEYAYTREIARQVARRSDSVCPLQV